ncbi:hypothetical protein [uncultured Streptococcus sp.]|uniref:hypothetical protein n=1 Tax=uncultured Streptococcus sp. TaxID=83427 RepID=UPI00259A23D9|nr:hypothetical protein [uncultured Streptococcus sp.]
MGDYIAHHGVKGQRWGVRKYYDENGKLTDLGKRRYAEKEKKADFKRQKALNNQQFKQQKALNEQASQHESKRRRGRVLAAAALVAIGAAAAKGIMNNIRANKLKLAEGQSRIKMREMLQKNKLKDHP